MEVGGSIRMWRNRANSAWHSIGLDFLEKEEKQNQPW